MIYYKKLASDGTARAYKIATWLSLPYIPCRIRYFSQQMNSKTFLMHDMIRGQYPEANFPNIHFSKPHVFKI